MAAEPNFFADPAIIADPRGYFETMRAKGPVARENHHGTLMVTGYDAAVEVLTNRDGTYSNACSVVGPIPELPFAAAEGADFREELERHRQDLPWADHLVCFDGAKHAEHRALLGSLLTYKRLKQNEDYLHGLADRLLDGVIGQGPRNVMREYAHATTVYAISDLLGIPLEDRAELLELIGAPPSQLDGDAVHKVGPDPLIFLKPRFDGYLRQRQARPGGDLLSELANASFRDGRKPDLAMLSALARFLFGAGQDTTSRLIAMAILILGENPGLQARLRAEPARIPDFLEEALRHDAPVKVAYRLAVADTAIGEVPVPAGTLVTVCLSAANNDPGHFPDPQRFDIGRPALRDHLGFSRGAHGCLGAPLGRMEARIAIERLLARTAAIRISDEHHGPAGQRRYRFEPTYTFRSLADLYVALDPAD